MCVVICGHAQWRELHCLQGTLSSETPAAAGDMTGVQAALSLTVACQHLRVDLCADAATAADIVPEERLVQDAAASVELTDLQVLTTTQSIQGSPGCYVAC